MPPSTLAAWPVTKSLDRAANALTYIAPRVELVFVLGCLAEGLFAWWAAGG